MASPFSGTFAQRPPPTPPPRREVRPPRPPGPHRWQTSATASIFLRSGIATPFILFAALAPPPFQTKPVVLRIEDRAGISVSCLWARYTVSQATPVNLPCILVRREPISASGAGDLPTVSYASSVGGSVLRLVSTGCGRAKETAASDTHISITATRSNLERQLARPNTKIGHRTIIATCVPSNRRAALR